MYSSVLLGQPLEPTVFVCVCACVPLCENTHDLVECSVCITVHMAYRADGSLGWWPFSWVLTPYSASLYIRKHHHQVIHITSWQACHDVGGNVWAQGKIHVVSNEDEANARVPAVTYVPLIIINNNNNNNKVTSGTEWSVIAAWTEESNPGCANFVSCAAQPKSAQLLIELGYIPKLIRYQPDSHQNNWLMECTFV